jgi:hypothetical protein
MGPGPIARRSVGAFPGRSPFRIAKGAQIGMFVLGEERAAAAAPEGRVVWVAEILVSRLIDEDQEGIGRKFKGIIHRAIRWRSPFLGSIEYDFSSNMALVIDFHGLVRFFMRQLRMNLEFKVSIIFSWMTRKSRNFQGQ